MTYSYHGNMGERMARDEHNDRTVIERVDPLVGSVLDKRYRIDFRLAAGGFGAIYRATHVKSGHQVALKVLHTDLATNDARVIARFRREGATLLQLRDQHTVTAYELGEDPDGPLYLVMELLHGESLYEQFRARGPLPWPRMVAIALQVCSSLGEAHALGIIHRDLKPANINLEKRGGNSDFVKVLDFGIAKIIRDGEIDHTELTQAGQMIGTFDYMAPEQMVGGQCTAATDIYTLGVVMYEMIAGRRPFADASSPTAMLASLLTLTPSPLSAFADVPPALDRVIAKLLEREPQNRYQTVAELSRDLERLVVADQDPPTEGITRRMNATPPPVLHDEVTVIDSRKQVERAKRESSHPNVVPREGSSPAIIAGERRERRETPNVVRRDSVQAMPQDARPKRDSSPPNANVVRRDPSQPPFEPKTISLQPPPPSRLDRRSADGLDPLAPSPRKSTPVIDPSRGSQPPFRASPAGLVAPPQAVLPPHEPVMEPTHDHLPTPDPRYAQVPYQQPYPAYPSPVPQQAPQLDARGSQPLLDQSGWNQPRPPQNFPPMQMQPPQIGSGYDHASAASREVFVRRLVWAIAILLGGVLAVVITSRL